MKHSRFSPIILLIITLSFAMGVDANAQRLPDSLRTGALGTDEGTLQDLLDGLGYTIDVANDELGLDMFCAPGGFNTATMVLEVAGSAASANSGYYETGVGSNRTQLFGPSDGPGSSVTFTIPGTISSIGFYMEPNLSSPSDVWYSESSLNSDVYDHVWVFPTGVPNEYVIGFEDLAGGGDEDYQDLVIKVVFDYVDPVLSGHPTADITVECDAVPPPPIVTATADCDPNPVVAFTETSTPGACPQEYVLTRTWTATDKWGGSASALQKITVVDTQPPVVTCPEPITVECLGDVPAVDLNAVTATDNCGSSPVIALLSETNDGQTCPKTITRTYKATDACGNIGTCTQTITVDDTTPPIVTAPAAITVECAGDIPAPKTSLVTAVDNCDPAPAVIFLSDVSDGQTCPETITRTYQATDACGNIGTGTQIITVDDTTPPVITCPADTDVLCDDPTDPSFTGTATATDNCSAAGAIIIAYSDNVNGAILRTWTATDECGNQASCVQTITATGDNEPPEITCPADFTVECLEDIPAAVPATITVSDNCDNYPVVVLVNEVSSGSTCPLTITRTFRATDASGNYVECDQVITVDDQTPPQLSGCPANTTISCDDPVLTPAIVMATDNCTGVTIAFVENETAGNCPEEKIITRTWTATDACGNQASCGHTITVEDTEAPSVTCPASISVDCAADVPAPNTSLVAALDNCDANPVIAFVGDVSDGQTCPETITRTYKATDACGNIGTCTQIITVDDTTPPVVTAPADAVVSCFAEVPPFNVALVTAVDNCDPTPTITHVGDVQNGTGCPLTITRTYRATDACGNFAEATQTITVEDQTPPQISCPNPITVECMADVPDPNPAMVTASDNCSGTPSVIWMSDSPVGTCPTIITRVYKATDDCGNEAFCEQIITVDDQTPPVLHGCPADVVVDCGGIPDPENVTATDNCDGVTIVFDDVTTPGACAYEYVVTRTWTATDLCGNTDECTQTITVQDNLPPQITCPADISVNCLSDVPVVNVSMVSATDNCDADPVITFVGDVQNGTGCPLTITRTYRATDACGNSSDCSQTITVMDQEPPVITCPGPLTVECSRDIPALDISAVTATDNCDPAPVITLIDQVHEGEPFIDCPTITRTYQAVDACGNVSYCTRTITVDDTTPPWFTAVPDDITISCNDPLPMLGHPGRIDGQDNCSGVQIDYQGEVITEGDCPGEQIVTRTFSLADYCGNMITHDQVITITDDVPPICTVPDDVVEVQCEPTEICGTVDVSDNCDPDPTLTVIDGPGEIVGGQWCFTPPLGSTSLDVVIRAEDICGNFVDASFHIDIEINTPPEITNCPEDLTINWNGGTWQHDFVAVDPDEGQSLVFSLCEGAPEGATIDETTGHFEWTPTADDICDPTICVIVTDDCQATALCEFDICVTNAPPVITCPDNITVCNGFEFATQVTATDPDGGPFAYFRLLEHPTGLTLDGVTGEIEWAEPQPGTWKVCVEAYDGGATCDPCSPVSADTGCFFVNVVGLDLVIEKVHNQFQNHQTTVSIDFLNQGSNWPIGGFDLLIQYDPTALAFLKATEGQFFVECDWEYFTYRYGASGNCGAGACPTGLLRIVAMAETTGGNIAEHPDCFTNDGVALPGPGSSTATELAVMHFLVTDDRTMECTFAPIRFMWYDCGDNALSNSTGDTLYISNNVYDYGGEMGDPPVVIWNSIFGLDNVFPTLTGAPSPECDLGDKTELVRCANFHNGGVDIVCADSIDFAGDVNINGIAYEIADAVMLTNYFVSGMSAFEPHVEGSIAASDTNRDGLTLSVADLVYLIRVVIGDAVPYAKVNPVSEQISYTFENGVLSISDDAEISGAALVIRGDVVPELLTDNMSLHYAFDGINTRIVVTPSVETGIMTSFSGEFLAGLDRELISLELATPQGASVQAKNVPVRFTLTQNYPNPFNPVTTVEFALPEPTDYSLTIFNIQGQVVGVHEGRAEAAGIYQYEWDASSNASGVYLYRLEAGDFTQTKKMLLLK